MCTKDIGIIKFWFLRKFRSWLWQHSPIYQWCRKHLTFSIYLFRLQQSLNNIGKGQFAKLDNSWTIQNLIFIFFYIANTPFTLNVWIWKISESTKSDKSLETRQTVKFLQQCITGMTVGPRSSSVFIYAQVSTIMYKYKKDKINRGDIL